MRVRAFDLFVRPKAAGGVQWTMKLRPEGVGEAVHQARSVSARAMERKAMPHPRGSGRGSQLLVRSGEAVRMGA